ncbi:Crp/Fnr family transcriptional regulator [Taibaiella sp. KBW10]|nr:Crp/Fnr family transcriptional regulator [Taibaiella sp. KBW10]
MLLTNLSLLSFAEKLYAEQERKEHIVLKSFDKGSLLLHQGQQQTKVMILKEGITKCFFSEANGKEYIVEFLGVGEIVGEIEVLRKIDCLCSIEAITIVQAYALSLPLFHSLLEQDLAFNRILLEELAERVVYTSSRASFQQLYTTEHGLAKLLALQEKQQIRLSKDDMAAYLGVNIRSLNRALKEMK